MSVVTDSNNRSNHHHTTVTIITFIINIIINIIITDIFRTTITNIIIILGLHCRDADTQPLSLVDTVVERAATTIPTTSVGEGRRRVSSSRSLEVQPMSKGWIPLLEAQY